MDEETQKVDVRIGIVRYGSTVSFSTIDYRGEVSE